MDEVWVVSVTPDSDQVYRMETWPYAYVYRTDDGRFVRPVGEPRDFVTREHILWSLEELHVMQRHGRVTLKENDLVFDVCDVVTANQGGESIVYFLVQDLVTHDLYLFVDVWTGLETFPSSFVLSDFVKVQSSQDIQDVVTAHGPGGEKVVTTLEAYL